MFTFLARDDVVSLGSLGIGEDLFAGDAAAPKTGDDASFLSKSYMRIDYYQTDSSCSLLQQTLFLLICSHRSSS